MKKRDLTTLAILGISAGLTLGSCQQNSKQGQSYSTNKAAAAEQMSPDMQAFYNTLSPDAQKKFMELDASHQAMAVEMANQKCNGQNQCAGKGGCATEDHECAGQNGCKGKGGAPVKDANKAVDVQSKNQMNARQKANGQASSPSSGQSNSGASSSSSQQGSSTSSGQ